MTSVNRVAPAPPAAAAAHFAARLAFETDVSDVHADIEAGAAELVVVDSRSRESWDAGHVPNAVHVPTAEIAARAAAEIPLSATVVTYCWGPGCNGSTRAALEFALLGYRVKEMIGGFEYWAREGLPVERADGVTRGEADPLVAPPSLVCGC
ncbi:rhodanese-like domain-containing protein [Actinokineospora sp. 24-640]